MRRRSSLLVCAGLACVVLGAPAAARAQDTKFSVYFGPGTEVDREPNGQIYTGGVGVERALAEHLAVQVDFDVISSFDAANSRSVGVIASFDAVGNVWLQRRTELFAAGGYSVLKDADPINLLNVGGGVRHWFTPDRGLLLEYRYHRPNDSAVPNKFWTVRIGLVFR